MKKILVLVSIALLLVAMGCSAKVTVTNSTWADVSCSLKSASKDMGDTVVIAAGEEGIEVSAKTKSKDTLILSYWWDGADTYATTSSDYMNLTNAEAI